MPLHELLSRRPAANHDTQDGNTKSRSKKVVDENSAVAGVSGSSRFKSMGKKIVHIPGKKDAGRKRRVFENMNNQLCEPAENKDVKRLKKTEDNKENRLTASRALATSRFGKKDEATKQWSSDELSGRKKTKARPAMPNIPIPLPLPSPLIKTNMELDDLTSAIDNLLTEIPTGDRPSILDYFCSPVYAHDIITYLQAQEKPYIISPTFLHVDSEVNPHMRSILIDWLTQVQSHLCIEQSTLHLAVRMIDTFVVRQKVALPKFQLVGITCLLIAAKFEERFAPSIEKLIHLTDNTYTMSEVLHMELVVLKVLRFKVQMPLPTEYLDMFMRCVQQTDVVTRNAQRLGHLSAYLLDLTLHDIHMVQWPASMVAASCLLLALRIITEYCTDHDMQVSVRIGEDVYPALAEEDVWGPLLQHFSGYSASDLLPCMQRCAKLLNRVERSKYQGARDNYQSNSRCSNISHWQGLKTPVVMELVTMEL